MKYILSILSAFTVLLIFACGDQKSYTYSDTVVLPNTFSNTTNISEVLLALKNSKFRNGGFLFFSESNLTDTALEHCIFNVHDDTVFVKVESEWLSDIAGDNRNCLLAWNNKSFVYVTDLLVKDMIDSTKLKNRIIDLKHEFINLVEKWDTATLRSKENHLFCSSRIHSCIYRIIFERENIIVDSFRFWDLSIPFKNEDGKLYNNTTYNPIHEFLDVVN